MDGSTELPHTPLSHGECCQLQQSTVLVSIALVELQLVMSYKA
jgi:hypothetical protein